MATVQNLYTGDGSTVLFSFTFPYLEEPHVKVSLDGVDTTAYTLANATTVEFDAAPANGVAIRIYRNTDIDAVAATFYPGSAIRAGDLNSNYEQTLYCTQEVVNKVSKAFNKDGSLPMEGDIDLGGFKLTNSGTPTAASDGATKGYVDAFVSQTSNIANNAVTAAKIAAGAVDSSELSTAAVTEAKIASSAVTANKIAAGAVGSSQLASSAVTTDKIATSAVDSTKLANNAVTSAKLATGSVGTTSIADLAVSGAKIASSAVDSTQLATNAVTAAKIATNAVDSNKIAPAAVTYAKIQNVSATDKLLGRSTAGAGVVEEIACTAAGRALLDDLTAADQRTTLGLGDSATKSVGTTAGTVAAGDDSRLTTDLSYTASTRLLASSTGADVTLPLFTSTEAGLVPLSGGGTTNFLRADGTWGTPSGSSTDLSYTASTRLLASSTGADVTLPLFTSTEAGLVPLSGGGTSNYLRADGTWATPAGGAGGATDLSYTASTRLLASSTGADVTLPLFTSTEAGLVPLSGGGTSTYLRADGSWATPPGGGGATDVIEVGNTKAQVVDTGSNGYFFVQTEGTERLRVDNIGYATSTVNGLGSGLVAASQFYRLNTSTAAGATSGVVSALGVGVTLVGSTVYAFEGLYYLTRASGTTASLQTAFGGTATLNNILYSVSAQAGNGATGLTMADAILTTASPTDLGVSARNYNIIRVKGTVSVNAGGTFIPQYGWVTSPSVGLSTVAGSFFRIFPIGASGANTSIGTWS